MSSKGQPQCYNLLAMQIPDAPELSERELEILKLVATGASNKEIAQKLFISTNTVKVHLRNIFNKIGATSRTEAAMYAVHTGLVRTISQQIVSEEETLQNLEHDTRSDLSFDRKGNQRSRFKRYSVFIGIFSILAIILLIIGLVKSPWNIISVNSSTPPTPTAQIQWFDLPGLPDPRWALAVISYDNQIYTIGGENNAGITNIVESFDPQTNAWKDLAPKPTAVSDINAVVIGGLIYVPGGKLESGMPTDVNEIYDPLTNHWSSGSRLPKPLSGYTLAVYEGQMYLFGGWDGSQVVNDAYVYDHNDDVWTAIPSMPTARAFAALAMVAGKMYIIGGWDGTQALSISEVYRPNYSNEALAWSQAPALPAGRYGMGITNIADIIFIIGGISPQIEINTIALSPGDKYWGQFQSPIPNNLSFLGVASIGTRLYIVGGKTDGVPSNQMWCYQVIYTMTLPIVR
jgi:DNA-binding CsgD family transcriptional regulator/N-acetylneuraminic acid mutarotase